MRNIRGVIVKTNKQFLEQQKQMFQPATEMQRDEAVQAGDRKGEEVCFFSEDGLFSVNVMEIQASTKYICLCSQYDKRM